MVRNGSCGFKFRFFFQISAVAFLHRLLIDIQRGYCCWSLVSGFLLALFGLPLNAGRRTSFRYPH